MKRFIDEQHSENQFKHTQTRALRRYGFDLDRSIYEQWNELIYSGIAKYALSYEHNKRFEVWALETEHLGKIAVGFDTLNNTISTILPRNSVDNYHYLAHSYECQLIAMNEASPIESYTLDVFDECEACAQADRTVRRRKTGYQLCASCASIATALASDMERAALVFNFFSSHPVVHSSLDAPNAPSTAHVESGT